MTNDDLPNVEKYKRTHPRTYPTYKHSLGSNQRLNYFCYRRKLRIVKCKLIILSRTINNNFFRLVIREKEEMMIKYIIDQKQKSDLSTVCFKKKTETSEGHNRTLVGSRWNGIKQNKGALQTDLKIRVGTELNLLKTQTQQMPMASS